MPEKSEYKLNFEIVPDGCWYNNLRNNLPKKVWDTVRTDAYSRANGKCMICGRKATRLEAHERWSYDEERAIQKLEDVIAVCHACHSVIHIGRTQLLGEEEKAEKHFCYVNKCSYADYRKALGKANEVHRRRNLVPEWGFDVSFLEKYGIKTGVSN
ncbi:MAG: HNH endonuclease [Clostridiales bacterium]|nr:HNH endonuclease [Clostridiales bacterium]